MTFSKVEYCIYFFLLVFGFLVFQQQDLHHTIGSSYAYLNGHFADFYDYNKTVVGGNDYLPFMYFIFAIWNLPLSIFGLLTENLSSEGWRHLALYEIYWNKFLLVTLFFVAANVIFKISMLLSKEDVELAKRAKYNFLLNPIAVFAVFLFGQYDIIGLVLSLIGYYFYLKKNHLKFLFYFTLSISLKYYSFIIFFPLLLLVEKNLFKIFFFCLISISLVILQAFIYWENPAFRETFLALPLSKLSTSAGGAFLGIFTIQNLIICLYVFFCVTIYFKKFKTWENISRASVLSCLIGYFLTFSAVNWHPQWLIIICPFIALSTIYIFNIRTFYFFQTVCSVSFFIIVAHGWPGNVDNALLYGGLFRSDIGMMYLRSSDMLPVGFLPFSGKEIGTLFYFGLGFPILLLIADVHIKPFIKNTGFLSSSIGKNLFLKINFISGMMIVIVPSMICILTPRDIALKYFPSAYDRSLILGLDLGPGVPLLAVGEIYGDKVLRQSILAEQDNLTRIDVIVGTYARKNKGDLYIELINDNKIIFSAKVNAGSIKDSEWFRVRFPPIRDSKGKMFVLQLSSPDTLPGNGVTLWSTVSNTYFDGQLTYDGAQLVGDINVKLFYERSW